MTVECWISQHGATLARIVPGVNVRIGRGFAGRPGYQRPLRRIPGRRAPGREPAGPSGDLGPEQVVEVEDPVRAALVVHDEELRDAVALHQLQRRHGQLVPARPSSGGAS